MNSLQVRQKVEVAIINVYQKDKFLFEEGLCERCINHRFAVYLERENFGPGYYVDCEYNKSHLPTPTGVTTSPKMLSSVRGNFIDIILTTRDGRHEGDFICFEIKRATNRDLTAERKDRKNLEILTDKERFGYKF